MRVMNLQQPIQEVLFGVFEIRAEDRLGVDGRGERAGITLAVAHWTPAIQAAFSPWFDGRDCILSCHSMQHVGDTLRSCRSLPGFPTIHRRSWVAGGAFASRSLSISA